MKINCLSCGHNIDLDEAYADHYEGQIKCFGCNASLEIRTEQSAVRGVRLAGSPAEGGASVDEAHSQTVPPEGRESGKPRTYKAHNTAKQGAPPLSEGGLQHASPASHRAA
ncbi:MAG: hypothetical protein WA005_11405 [Candidatus Binataceae bacterium]